MQKLKEIKNKLEWGDVTEVSRISGYSERQVRMILAGQRRDHRNVIGICEDIIENRANIKKKYAGIDS